MPLDIHNKIKVVRSISPVAVGTTGTGQTGKVVDRSSYEGVELILGYGSITATNATFTVTMLEGDATGTMTSVANADLLGTESAAGIAAGTRTSGTNKNVSKRLGYIGAKRYVQAKIVSTITAGTPVSASFLLTDPRVMPVAT